MLNNLLESRGKIGQNEGREENGGKKEESRGRKGKGELYFQNVFFIIYIL